MAKFKVRLTKTDNYVHETIVEAENREAAILIAGTKNFEFPEKPGETKRSSEAEEIADLTNEEIETLRRWVRRVTYFDEDDNGIATVSARFGVRDHDDFMERVRDAFSHDDAKALICGIIDSFAFPCEDYADDFDDPDSAFQVSWEYLPLSHTIEVKATIRT